MSAVIEANHLHKEFKEINAVNDLSFTVNKGEVYGFLGQNGSGKSTTIRMLLTLIKPSSGHLSIFGKNLNANRASILRKIGAIVEKPDAYNYLTARKNIEIVAALSGVKVSATDIDNVLHKVGLYERSLSKVNTFSQGMKQRLGLACALIHEPDLIILDEPTNGLDPQGIADVRTLIKQLCQEEGKTIFLSSHLLSEIEVVADSMLIIDKGKMVAEGKVSNLLNPADTNVILKTTDDPSCLSLLQNSQWQNKLKLESLDIILHMHKQDVPLLTRFLVESGINILSINPKHSLEEYFLSLTSGN